MRCWRRRRGAAAAGFGLLLWDGYRPQRAVDRFLAWSAQPEDGRTKQRFYPNIDRAEMFTNGYVAPRSGHSRGSAVDLTLYRLDTGELAPMGGGHDLMDERSHHGATGVSGVAAPRTAGACVPSWSTAGSDGTSASGGTTRCATSRTPTPTSTSPSCRRGDAIPFQRGRATAAGGRLRGPDVWIEGASFDSRSLRPGSLFVPIVAARDGHDHIADAFSAGAAASLTSRPVGSLAPRGQLHRHRGRRHGQPR